MIPFSERFNTKSTIEFCILTTNFINLDWLIQELCSFCMETKETLLHHLWECHYVKTVWIRVKESLNNYSQTNILLHPQKVIFNIYEGEHSDIINTCFLLIKKYLYNCKCNYRLPTFEQAISYVKYYKTIELHSCIYYSATKARKVKDKWEIISHAFQLVISQPIL